MSKTEKMRSEDITAMDVYAAKLSASATGGRSAAVGPAGTKDWMDLALTVEERQSVIYFPRHLKHWVNPLSRVEVQSKVRQVARKRGGVDMEAIEKDCGQLTVLYLELRRAQQAANIMESNNVPFVDVDGLNIWDDVELDIIPNSDDMPIKLDQAPETAPAPAGNSLGPSTIEDYLIPLPSNGNVDICHRNLELTLRYSRAEHHLTRIRELIAEKSFQYSHVMRVSPRKGTTTCSRASVKKLNTEIALHCRLYARCRARLILLGGDQSRFKVLTPNDVKASTAIINPNESGSTRLKLSWIWESSDGHRFGLAGAGADASVVKCLFSFQYSSL
jgi:hypothetical protein